MNKVILIGNLTHDIEMRSTANGTAVCNFDIAVNRKYENENGDRETDFFKIVVWRALAENCAKYLCKGKKVCVMGELQNRQYTDNQGVKRTVTEIIANEVEFLTPPSKEQDNAGNGQMKLNPMPYNTDDDIPF